MRYPVFVRNPSRWLRGRAPLPLLLAALVALGILLALVVVQRFRAGEASAGRVAELARGEAFGVRPVGSESDGVPAAGTESAKAGGRLELVASPLALDAPLGRPWTIRVVAGIPERPVAGATVRLLGHRPYELEAGRQLRPSAAHRSVETLLTAESNSEGLVSLPHHPDAASVDGRAEGNWGWFELESDSPGDGPVVLRLEPDRSASVVVLDGASGRPLPGVEVQLNYYLDETSLAEQCDSGVSNGEGRVHFEHLTQHMTWFWPHREFLAVETVGNWDPAARVRVDYKQLHNDLELPIAGFTSLRVVVLDKRGEPFLGDGSLTVSRQMRSGEDPEQVEYEPSHIHANLRDGVAVFSQLAPGARVRVSHHSTAAPPENVDDVALAGVGEEREATLRLSAAAAQWRVHLRTVDGVDLSGGRLEFPSGAWLDLPKDGKPVAINPYAAGFEEGRGGSTAVECWLRLRGWHGTLHAPPAAGDGDLGTIVLEPLPVSVGGTVVDPRGVGIDGVRISQEWRNSRGRWTGARHTTTDAEGRFEMSRSLFRESSSEEGRTMSLRLRHTDYQNLVIDDVLPGSAGLRIELLASGRIEGSLWMDEMWMRDFLEVRAHCEATSKMTPASVNGVGELNVGGLPTGSYTVTFKMVSEEVPLEKVERVPVVAGEVTRDPRLQGVDLRGRIGWLELRVRDAEGNPVPDAWARARVDEADEWGQLEYAQGPGRVYIFSRLAPGDVFVGAEGYVSTVVRTPRDGDQVVLDRARTFALHWDDTPAELPNGVRLRVEGLSTGTGRPAASFYPSMAPSAEHTEPEFWDGGTHMELTVVLSSEGDRPNIHRLPPLRYTIPPDTPHTVLSVPFPLAEMKAYAERMGVR